MSEVKKGVSFVKEVVARITGDEDKVIAEKNYRKATSAIKSQINNLEASLVDKEDNLEEAKEALAVAKYPTVLITDRDEYASNILMKRNDVIDAEDDLQETKDKIEYFKTILKEFE